VGRGDAPRPWGVVGLHAATPGNLVKRFTSGGNVTKRDRTVVVVHLAAMRWAHAHGCQGYDR
jgi:hypothetical protein